MIFFIVFFVFIFAFFAFFLFFELFKLNCQHFHAVEVSVPNLLFYLILFLGASILISNIQHQESDSDHRQSVFYSFHRNAHRVLPFSVDFLILIKSVSSMNLLYEFFSLLKNLLLVVLILLSAPIFFGLSSLQLLISFSIFSMAYFLSI